MELAHNVAQGIFEGVGEMLATTSSMAANLLGLLMTPVEGAGEQQNPSRKRKSGANGKKSSGTGYLAVSLRMVHGIRPLHCPAKITHGVGKVKGILTPPPPRPLPSGALDPILPPCVRWPKR